MPRRRRPPRPGALQDLSPLRLLTQIIVLQVLYYVTAALLLLFTALVAGQTPQLDLLLSWRTIRGDTTFGWTLGLVWMLDALICVIYLLLLIARSKLIPDFACTVTFLHLITTSLYTHSIPSSLAWWLLQAASTSLMAFLGVWVCQYRELRPISFGGNRVSAPSAQGDGQPSAEGEGGDEEQGFARGRGRGRDRDGAGEYEMVAMSEHTENG